MSHSTMPLPPGDTFAATFRALHDAFFVMPNPWDIVSARLLASLGFPAIATSSSAYAWTMGLRDGALSRDEAIAHAVAIGSATGLPVNGDFEDGYGRTDAEVAATISASIEAGIAGCSVEDFARESGGLYDIRTACRRVEAARNAVDKAGSAFVLTARCEAFITGDPVPLATVCERLPLYRAAGAHVLYAPGVTTREALDAVLEAADGLPVNVLTGAGGISDDLAALRQLGVRRISTGSALARTVLGALTSAAASLSDDRVALTGRLAFSEVEKALGSQGDDAT